MGTFGLVTMRTFGLVTMRTFGLVTMRTFGLVTMHKVMCMTARLCPPLQAWPPCSLSCCASCQTWSEA